MLVQPVEGHNSLWGTLHGRLITASPSGLQTFSVPPPCGGGDTLIEGFLCSFVWGSSHIGHGLSTLCGWQCVDLPSNLIGPSGRVTAPPPPVGS
jgi:hypothetical protein